MSEFTILSAEIVGGVEGPSFNFFSYENSQKDSGVGSRIHGPKAWGGGRTLYSCDIGKNQAEQILEEIYRVYPDAIPKRDTRPINPELLALREQVEKQRWISVKERLPEDGVQVLVCDSETSPCIGWYRKEQDQFFGWDNDLFPTHWMPLPEPLQIGQGEAG